jgi:chromosome segregation ATPase
MDAKVIHMPIDRSSQATPQGPQAKPIDSIRQDIHTLDSKISLIAQKLRTIEQNEEIIGRTIVAHNQKIKELEDKSSGPVAQAVDSFGAGNSEDIKSLKKEIEDLRKEIREMRYVLDSINPLEFVTVDQVKDMLKEKKV